MANFAVLDTILAKKACWGRQKSCRQSVAFIVVRDVTGGLCGSLCVILCAVINLVLYHSYSMNRSYF